MPPRRTQRGPVAVTRRNTVRLPEDAVSRIAGGHPWVFRDALGSRKVAFKGGDVVTLVDGGGSFVGRGLFEETGAVAVRIWSRSEDQPIDGELVRSRVASAVQLRSTLVPPDVSAYRLINSEGDGLPTVVVDRYGDYLLVQIYSEQVVPFLPALHEALQTACQPKAIYEQRRFRSLAGEAPAAKGATMVHGDAAPVDLEVQEGAHKFWVDVTAPLATGLFLDLRCGRNSISHWAKGKRVLNLFSYTGALSLVALAGGATAVVAVDAAAKGHARSRRNLELNGHDAEAVDHRTGDVMALLAKSEERGERFDMVVLDPPAFGTGGKGATFRVSRNLRELIAASLRVLNPGGVLFASTAVARLQRYEFDRALAEGAADANTNLRIVERVSLPPDFCVLPGFEEGNTLKAVVALRS